MHTLTVNRLLAPAAQRLVGVYSFNPSYRHSSALAAPIKLADHKRLIVCCDGTWQSSQKSGSHDTNVTRFCRAIKTRERLPDNSEIQQVVLYQPGIGASKSTTIGQYLAGGLGLFLDDHVTEAYSFLSNNYETGDEIFLFGYSRGAYTARAVAGLIGNIGLLENRSLHRFPRIYKEYRRRRNSKKSRNEWETYIRAEARILHRQSGVKIKVVGCWDTVGSLGIPEFVSVPEWWRQRMNRQYEFHDAQLSTSIENAFHCLSLDERRKSFIPTLWYLPRDTTPQNMPHVTPVPGDIADPSAMERLEIIKLRQIWMIGIHADVGGHNHFSNIAFKWMVDQCQGLLVFDKEYIEMVETLNDDEGPRLSSTAQDINSIKHIFTFLGSCYRKVPTYAKSFSQAVIEIVGAGNRRNKDDIESLEKRRATTKWITEKTSNSLIGIFFLLGRRYRTPGQYTAEDFEDDEHGTLYTNELIHPSVRIRMRENADWRPPALEGFRVVSCDGKWKWVKQLTLADGTQKTVELDEYEIASSFKNGGHRSVEEELMLAEEKKLYDKNEVLEGSVPVEYKSRWCSFRWLGWK